MRRWVLAAACLLLMAALACGQDYEQRLIRARNLERSAPEEALRICDQLLQAIPHWIAVHQLKASIHCNHARVAACLASYEEAFRQLESKGVRSTQPKHIFPTLHNYAVTLTQQAMVDPAGARRQLQDLPPASRERLEWLRQGTVEEVAMRAKEVLEKCPWTGDRRRVIDCARLANAVDGYTAVSLIAEAINMPQSPEPISDAELYAAGAKICLASGSRTQKTGEELARKALALGQLEAAFDLVDFFVMAGRYEKGLPVLAEAHAVSPLIEDDPRYWIYRANLFGIAGDKRSSIDMLTELIARHDGEYLGSAYHNRAIDLNGLGDYRASHQDHRNAVVTSFREYAAEPSRNPNCAKRQVRAGYLTSLEGIPGVTVTVGGEQLMPVVELHNRFATGTSEGYREFYEEQFLLPGKQLSFLTMQDVELFEMSRLIVGDCDVIVPNVAMHHFASEAEPVRGTKTTHLLGKTYIASTYKMSSNYYHLLIDVIPSLEHAMENASYDHIVYHASALMEQALDLMRVPEELRVPFDPNAAPFLMEEAVYIDTTGDWKAFNAETGLSMGEEDTEGEFKFYPAYESLKAVRRAFIPHGHLPPSERTLVIYAHRPPPTHRSVENSELLVNALEKEFGDRLLVHLGKDMTLVEQAELFQRAALIVGPHGAGMTNSVYMGPGSAIVEMPVRRTRYFAYLAAQLDLDYWVVPEAEGMYEGHFSMTPSLAEAITRTCREALARVDAHNRTQHAHDEL